MQKVLRYLFLFPSNMYLGPDVGIIGIDGITVAANAHVVVTEWPFQGRDGR